MLAKSLLVSALATVAFAQSKVLFFTRVPNPVTAGSPQAITYSTNDTASPVTIILRQGIQTDLQTIETLTTDASGGQYIWTPKTSLPNANDYALQIEQKGQVNYYGPFTLQGGSIAGASSSSSSSSGTASGYISGSSSTASTTASGNSTKPTGAPYGTGNMTMTHSNTTMTSATSTSGSTSTTGSVMVPTNSAGFQTSPAAPTNTGAASTLVTGGSAAALFGAIFAMLFC